MTLIKCNAKEIINSFGNITGLFPVSEKDIEEYKKIKVNEKIKISWDYERNKKHHDKYWSILEDIIEHYNNFGCLNVEMLHISIKYELGYTKEIIDLHGQKRIIPDSISFQKMGQKKFEKFYNCAIDLLTKMLKVSREELENDY